jgi:hypothetical protein
MKWNRIIWILVIFLVLPTNCYAFGVAPSSIDIMFEPNLEKTVNLKILNSEGEKFKAIIYAEGELADYVIINTSTVEFSGEKEKVITFTIKLPEKIDQPGEHEAKIVIGKISSKREIEGTTIAAVLAVASRINVMVPYSGKYASVRLFAPHFKANEESNFAVEIANLGEKTIFATAIIDIMSPLNEKITTLKSEEVRIDAKEKKIVTIKWKPTSLGNYYARTSVIYNDHEARDERAFTIGDVFIDINSISVDKFFLGGIAKFDIIIENKWNERIPGVYADITITDNTGRQYAISKTASKDVEAFGKQELEAFWDTKNVEKGRYKLNIVLNYLDKKTEKTFDIDVGFDKIDVTPSGQIIAVPEKEEKEIERYINILIVLVLIVLGVNIFIYLKIIRRR